MLKESKYGIGVVVKGEFEATVARATDALKAEGFGILTTIDVTQTLKQKLNVDFRKYVILGACNPPLSHRALLAELEIGLLLPCNVIVYDRGDGTMGVSAMAPVPAMGMVANPALASVAAEADARLRRVLAVIEGGR